MALRRTLFDRDGGPRLNVALCARARRVMSRVRITIRSVAPFMTYPAPARGLAAGGRLSEAIPGLGRAAASAATGGFAGETLAVILEV